MFEAVFFDFFGTLVQYSSKRSTIDFVQSHQYLKEHSIELDYETFISTWNDTFSRLEEQSFIDLQEFSMDDVLAMYLDMYLDKYEHQNKQKLSDDVITKIKSEFIDIYMSEWTANITPYPGLHNFLSKLSSKYKLAVVSNTHHLGLVPKLLEKFEIAGYFDSVITSIDHGRPKPHESIYKTALDSLAVTPGQSIFIGDSVEHDYLAPRKLGFYSILVSQETVTVQEDVPSEHIVSVVNDLENLVFKLKIQK